MNPQAVPIPRRMAQLDRDARGYPVPVIILRDDNGRPHFTINDERMRVRCLIEKLCSICGQPLEESHHWHVGGPLSAFDPHGAYNDLPVHHECMRYAMIVCPYLAMPRYPRRIDARTLQDDTVRLLIDNTMIPDRPEVFVCVRARDYDVSFGATGFMVKPKRPYQRVEFWRQGNRLPSNQGWQLVAQIVQKPLPELQHPRIMIGGKASK